MSIFSKLNAEHLARSKREAFIFEWQGTVTSKTGLKHPKQTTDMYFGTVKSPEMHLNTHLITAINLLVIAAVCFQYLFGKEHS